MGRCEAQRPHQEYAERDEGGMHLHHLAVGNGSDCDPSYTASFTYQVQNNTVIFVANFITPTLGVVWTFPDGSQAYEPIHTHLFEPPGPYEVCLSTWYWSELTQDTCWATS